ncbi:ALK and LTK ligand 1 [Diceros bicornis minor]|uniref:ALK and LTK ligand 1 n=1 Tax=Diceros bicornis minor TaxID=77932 RepID=UPI0026EDFF15|nr:ALK and LTK ligand 1 [Diceros bicornis minor]XP_058384990.1 ALK and LTK ligand 1 [Diceros bicornis minor]
MRPAKPGAPLPALLLLALALSPQDTQGRPRGRRGARVANEEPKLFLPAAGAGPASSASRSAEIFPRDLNLKDKFIKHFTGPVTFSAECKKHFHRLYHNTRDCSTPAYYKRCARLLTRLAVSPLCSQT